jgi:phospholipid/cholesterol/gamma-HCH transport system substrate-binding protein
VNQTARNFLLGLTSIVAIGGLVVLLLLFGELEAIVKRRYVLTVDCMNAVGLRRGSTIELNGVPIGEVDDVMVLGDGRFPVRLVALIDQTVQIPDDVVPYATVSLLGGSATLELEGTVRPGGPILPTDGTATLKAEIRSRLIEQITNELDARMSPVVDALAEFQVLAHNLNELVEPPDPGRPGEVLNIRTAVEALNEVLADVHEALALARSWLGDEQLRADTRDAVHNANLLIDQATATLDQYMRLAGRLEADAESVSKRLLPVFDELSTTLDEVRGIAAKANDGQGTIAQLLNNPDLYQSLDDAALRLERTLREVQLLLEKIKGDGLRVVW